MTKEEKKTTIEVTEAQKEEIVQLFAKKQEQKEQAGKTVKMNLSFGHSINGKHYGPGETIVPAELEGHFESGDYKALQMRLRENQSSEEMVQILGRGITRKVKA